MRLVALFTLLAAIFAQVSAVAVVPNTLRLDTCAYIRGRLQIRLPLIGLVSLGQLDVCLCISTLPLYLRASLAGKALLGLVRTEAQAIAELSALIGGNGGCACSYPPAAQPICQNSDPCGFTCTNGYVRVGNECRCPSPRVDCNGVCLPAGQACSSNLPRRRSPQPWMDAQCPPKWSVCGVVEEGSLMTRGYECTDTQSEPTSCGGCIMPLLPTHKQGRDCTMIPGALITSCIGGGCYVHSCKPGYTISASSDECIPIGASSQGRLHTIGSRDSRAVDESLISLASRDDDSLLSLSTSSQVEGDVLVLDGVTLRAIAMSDDPYSALLEAYYAQHTDAS